MQAIRRHHPDAHITLLTTAPFENFARSSGYFDDIWLDERLRALDLFKSPRKWLDFRKRLNRGQFTRVYDLQNNDRTALYLKLFSVRPQWVGTAAGASHRNAAGARRDGHAFDRHVQTLAGAGINDVKIDDLRWIDADIGNLGLHKPFVLLAAGSAPQRPEKRWPADKYGRLAAMLAGLGYQPVLLGTAAEKQVNAQIRAACPQALDLTEKTSLYQIIVLGREAEGAIGNDTGPMHMIAPTQCPCLVLFSAYSDPIRHAPKGKNVKILQEAALADLKSEIVLKNFEARQEPPQKASTTH